MAAAGGRAGWLDVVHVRGDGLQRAPACAGDVRQVGRRPVGGRDCLAHTLDVAHGPPPVRRVGPWLGERHKLREEALELGPAHPLADQPPADLLQLVVVAPGDPEGPPCVREPRVQVRGVPRLPCPLGAFQREHHSVQAREPERCDADRDREAAVVAVAEAQKR